MNLHNNIRFRAKVAKKFAFFLALTLCAMLLICMAMWIYRSFIVDRQRTDFAAKVENVKTMVRHNSLEIVDETIFADTIDKICEVYSIKARITVTYDLEKMKYQFCGDTLVVELPKEIIEAHELDRRLLDQYYTDGKFHVSDPAISPTQSREMEYRMKQFVKTKMLNAEHIKRARTNELRNMVHLLHAINGNVRVVLNINDPSSEVTPRTLPTLPDM